MSRVTPLPLPKSSLPRGSMYLKLNVLLSMAYGLKNLIEICRGHSKSKFVQNVRFETMEVTS